MKSTLAEAIKRVGPDWVAVMPAAKILEDEGGLDA